MQIRKPKTKKCAGCNIQFMEWSVDHRLAQRVGYRICFCQDCYYRALYGAGKMSPNKTIMLDQLAVVSKVLGQVPNQDFHKHIDMSETTDQNQILLIKTLLSMPSYKDYVKEFGSWLNALTLSNVLEEGTRRTAWGVSCIANDGHLCNSLAEKRIDDWLSSRNIPHEKEPTYPYHKTLNPSNMRADWKVGDFFIEYAGLMNEPTYAEKMKTKKQIATIFDIPLIIIEPEDIHKLEKKLDRLSY